MNKPLVTVLMPAWNASAYIAEAVNSVLAQTFAGYELLIINDGSTDNTAEILSRFSDPRIRILHNETNLRLIATLNRGLDEASGKYIARFDADDIMLPQRLEKQVALLESAPQIGLAGSFISLMDEKNTTRKTITDSKKIPARLIFANPFFHPSVMIRKSVLVEHQLRYDAAFPHAEDYELWTRLVQFTEATNIPEPLVQYRQHPQQISVTQAATQKETLQHIHTLLMKKMGMELSAAQQDIHFCIYAHAYENNLSFAEKAEQYLQEIVAANEKSKHYDQAVLRELMGEEWFRICSSIASAGTRTQKIYKASPLASYFNPSLSEQLKFAAKRFFS